MNSDTEPSPTAGESENEYNNNEQENNEQENNEHDNNDDGDQYENQNFETHQSDEQYEGSERPKCSIFVGNCDSEPSIIKEHFQSFGFEVLHVDHKQRFCFVHCAEMENVEDILLQMKGKLFRGSPKIPTIELTKGNGFTKQREEERKKVRTPADTLFVVGFDPERTTEKDILTEFGKIGSVRKVTIRKNFCFVSCFTVDDAVKILQHFHNKDVFGRTLCIEYWLVPALYVSDRDLMRLCE